MTEKRIETAESLRNAFGYLYPDELPFLKKLAKEIETSPCVVLNIGAGAGTSGLAFAESREDLILHTVDKSDLSNPLGCLESERDWMKWGQQDHRWGKTWFQHHMSSHDLDDIWAEITGFLTIDLLFIDGDHTYEGCLEDIYGFYPYVRLGGLIAVHDYGKADLPLQPYEKYGKALSGVDRAVDISLPFIASYYDRVDSTVVYRK
jgi:predicted O-methyltransferase YrrM